MNKKTIYLLFLFIFLSLLSSVNILLARNIRSSEVINTDNFGTRTFYKKISGKFTPTLRVDKNGNVLEKYFYRENKLRKARVKNLYSGNWIDIKVISNKGPKEKIDGLYSYKFKISTGGRKVSNKILYNYWIIDKEIEFITTLLKKDSPKGIGLSIKNWFIKYMDERYGVESIRSFNTNNPGILVISEKLISSKVNYKIDPESYIKFNGYKNLNKKEILKAVGSFRVNEVGSEDNIKYKDGSYIDFNGTVVEIKGNNMLSTEWLQLDNKNLKDIEIGDHWKIIEDGNILGKIKAVGDPDHVINLKGSMDNPIGMYIDKKGNIIQYQGKEIIKVIENK